MAEKIMMPQLSDTMEEGTVAKWHKKVGDKVSEGDILVEIETDKAIQDFESEYDGYLIFQGVEEGSTVPVGELLMVIGEKGEEFKSDGNSADKKEEKKEEAPKEEEKVETSSESSSNEIPDGVNVITIPQLSDTMEEGTVAKWHKNVGDKVSEGDVIVEIETDKAVQDFESEYDGVLLKIGVEEGDSAPVGTLLAIIGPAGTDVSGMTGKPAEKKETPKEETKKETKPEDAKSETVSAQTSSSDGERIFASPLARSMAEEKGIDLSQVKGTGDNGRIIKRDIENFKPVAAVKAAPAASTASASFGFREDQMIPNSQMRKVIARRLAESKFTAPHYYLNVSVNMDNCMASRKKINEANPDKKVSFNDIIIKAVAMALRKHPQVNSTWQDNDMLIHGDINIGVAVAVDDGLLVPVVKNADFKTFSEISVEVKDMAVRARDRKIKADEMEGSTFTVSNLGMFGIESFTSIINQPNSCILSVGAIIPKPIVKDGQITVGNMMALSMACDHRTVDGATGAQFLQTLVNYLENPVAMLA